MIRHPFVSLITDVGGPTYVQPTHWNQPHNAPPIKILDYAPATLASIAIPSTAGPTGYEYYDNTSAQRRNFDFTYIDTVNIFAGVASHLAGASAALRLQYMPSGFPGSWYSFDATGGSLPFVSLASQNNASLYALASNGQRLGVLATVSAAAKALPQPLTVRIAGYGGSGTYTGLGAIDVIGV
jgi:hypothetical protein